MFACLVGIHSLLVAKVHKKEVFLIKYWCLCLNKQLVSNLIDAIYYLGYTLHLPAANADQVLH